MQLKKKTKGSTLPYDTPMPLANPRLVGPWQARGFALWIHGPALPPCFFAFVAFGLLVPTS